MSLNLDEQTIIFICPHCDGPTRRTFSWARTNTEFKCRCGTITPYGEADSIGVSRPVSTFSSKFETSGFNFTKRS